jgi:hypothetical protein
LKTVEIEVRRDLEKLVRENGKCALKFVVLRRENAVLGLNSSFLIEWLHNLVGSECLYC